MHPLSHDAQTAFAAALLDPAQAVPRWVKHADGRIPQQGFAAYRNNVIVSLTDALRFAFPVTARLVGDEFFAATARVFIPEHLPKSPILLQWGAAFPDFLAGFPPARSVPYLSDIARLEISWNRAYHAADASFLTPAALGPMSAEELGNAVLKPHPSAQIVVSRFPIAAIWGAHQAAAEPGPVERWEPESVLVVRPGAEVLIYPVSQASACFAASLFQGKRIGEAAAEIADCFADFDLTQSLVGLFQIGAISDLHTMKPSEVVQ